MGSDAADQLAIRTVVVTTRAAARSHRRSDRPDLARESAIRGLLLLEYVAETRDLRNGAAAILDEARRELRALSEAP
jgi:hypothetical protein